MTRIHAIALALLAAACSGEAPGVYVGYVEAEHLYPSALQSGRLERLAVAEGDRVEAGAVLFELDADRETARLAQAEAEARRAAASARDLETGARTEEIDRLEAERAEAQTRLDLARAELNRTKPLVATGVASKARGDQAQAEYDAALSRVRAAEDAIEVARLAGRDAAREAADAAAASADAALAEARWALDQRTGRAPAAGTVEDVFLRPGEVAGAGAPVLALLPEGALKVRFFVPQADLPGLEVGGAVRIEPDGAAPIDARISFIATEAEFTPPVIYSNQARDKLVFLVEARLPSGATLRPGLPVDVRRP